MPSTLKTPGVYIEEVSKFPPSIAPVATAIPAFIGYTEKAKKINNDDRLLVPTLIYSMVEFEALFGGAPLRDITTVHIDANNQFVSAEMASGYHLYDSLRLFFQNGGSKCYIISIGKYPGNVNHLSDYLAGLAALKMKDEPTLIVFPDAINIDPRTDLYNLQQQALQQCGQLKDRFCIFDLRENDPNDASFDWATGIDQFRQNIGMAYLSYGAAYTPYIQASLDIVVTYAQLKNIIFRGGVAVNLANLTNDQNTLNNIIPGLDRLLDDQTTLIAPQLSTLKGGSASIEAEFQAIVDTFKGNNTDANFELIINKLYDIAAAIEDWRANLTFTSLQTDVVTQINQSLGSAFAKLVSYEKGADTELPSGTYTRNSTTAVQSILTNWSLGTPVADTSIYGSDPDDEQRKRALGVFENLFLQFMAGLNTILQYASNYEKELNTSLYTYHVVYKNLVDSLRTKLSALPPSGAIAGIYARVDNERGVWKAPANVSVLGIKDVTQIINAELQEDLNVDTLAGKSINAIRAFTGKGTLVWGGRTLAGNDNEWRYISVRRFFSAVEESIKKATERFVFEPNDANTWVKVRAMIENFLTIQWRAGALAGAKTEEAFYVRVGLNQTMTALDVLEGRMIVEIGMAVVRPAEFIVLRFSHKMQES